jgi:RNA polymerase sigma factor (sigma-70 family)
VAPIGQQVCVESDRSDAAVIASSVVEASRFGEIFDRHFAEIDRYLARRVGTALADDLAAETFVIAFRSRGRYDPRVADARPWLFGIAANLARRHWRTERRRPAAYARTGVDPIDDDAADVERRVDAVAAAAELAAVLASLSAVEREVLLLFAWADLSRDEISTALRIPVGTVRSRLSRARAHVRELLSPSGQVAVEGATRGGTNG